MLTIVALAALLLPCAGVQATGGLTGVFPDGRKASLVVPDGTALLDSRLGTALGDLVLQQGDADGLARLAGAVRLATGAEPAAVLRRIVGAELELGVYEGRGRGARPRSRRLLGVARSADADDLRRLCDAVVALVEAGDGSRVERARHAERAVAIIDGNLALCAADGLLLFATDEHLLREALDRVGQVGPPAPRGGEATLLHFELDTALLRAQDARAITPPIGRARRYANPLVNLLFAGLGEREGLIAGALHEREGRILLTTRLPAAPDGVPAAYDPPIDGTVEVPVDPETAAVLFVRRDLAEWWRRRETLLDESLQPQLAKFDQTLGLLFMGGSPAEDVFAGLAPELALVVDRLDFAAADAIPDVRMPGACLVARMRDPAQYATGMQVAFQSLIGIANTERGKDGKPPFLLETAEHEGHTLRCARLVPDALAGGMAGASGSADAERALSPTLAFTEDLLLLGTSEEQVRRLLSAWGAGRRARFEGNTELRLHPDVLARLVRDNRGPLVAKSMLDDGLDPAQAGQRIDAILDLLGHLGPTAILLADEGAGALLDLRIDAPAEQP
jgi:hypothetical protein